MKKNIIFSLLVVIIAGLLFSQCGKEDNVYIRAVEMWESGKYEKAINELLQKSDVNSYQTTVLIMEIASDWFNYDPSFKTQAPLLIMGSKEKMDGFKSQVSITREQVNSCSEKVKSDDKAESVQAQIDLIILAHNDKTGFAAYALSQLYKKGIRGKKYEGLASVWELTTYQLINDSLDRMEEKPDVLQEDKVATNL